MPNYSTTVKDGKLVFVMGPAKRLFPTIFAPALLGFLIYTCWRYPRDLDFFTAILGVLLATTLCFAFLANFGSKEELEVTPKELLHRRFFFRWSWLATYKMPGISNPRFVPRYLGLITLGRSQRPSALGFTYLDRERRLFERVTQDDAKEIVLAMQRQFPELIAVWGHYADGSS